ncbi:hypothetical protein [Paracraurococcus ruber]|uniref:Uncharacterized protein n=1 Tax=Paracraurococcus ruber TaxID=77675 RepID=A0ABS1CRG3_9PROT|nr:hypothetical protein [Paracraurococcus ruber]MBK1657041.1 hypothetical protein [Paracraurococcus ruber]TDG32518.1 hypothetical protein E2C05_06670 [Paracraurococcus ruber]
MFLPRCTPPGLPGPLSMVAAPLTMAGTAMGGMAMLASIGPFLAGLGVGAGLVGASLVARKAMERRSGWRDDPVDPLADAMPDEGDAATAPNPL